MTMTGWRRVSNALPCPICKKTDWCIIATDGTKAICQRVESLKKFGEAGFLHNIDNSAAKEYAKLPAPQQERKRTDLAKLARDYAFRAAADERIFKHAAELGVSHDSLKQLSVGWDGYAWTFPMVDDMLSVIGIMRRYHDGRKLSVKGGTLGLFVPTCIDRTKTYVAICEGATDTAAVLSMGVGNVIGRPNCGSGAGLITKFIANSNFKNALLVADNDDAGVGGAKELASHLVSRVNVKIVTPPAGVKDMRAWLKAGCTLKTLKLMAFVSPWYTKS